MGKFYNIKCVENKSSNIGKGQQMAQRIWLSGSIWPKILEIGFILVSGAGFSPKYRRKNLGKLTIGNRSSRLGKPFSWCLSFLEYGLARKNGKIL